MYVRVYEKRRDHVTVKENQISIFTSLIQEAIFPRAPGL